MVRAFVNSSHLVTGVPGSALILSDHEDGKALLGLSFVTCKMGWTTPPVLSQSSLRQVTRSTASKHTDHPSDSGTPKGASCLLPLC